MFCEKCGAKINDGEQFCSACGEKCNINEDVNANAFVSSENDQVEHPDEEIVNDEINSSAKQSNEIADGFCDKCGNRMQSGDVVCSLCGNVREIKQEEVPDSEEERTCKKCGSILNPGEVFCSQCGKKNPIKKQKRGFFPKTRNKIFVAIASIVAIVAIYFAVPYVVNAFAKLFLSPEDYFGYVVNNSFKGASKELAQGIDSIKNYSDENTAFEGKINVMLHDEFYDLIDSFGGDSSEISWLNDAALGYNGNVHDGVVDLSADFDLNNTDIVSGRVVYDSDESEIYVGVPELNSEYGYYGFGSSADMIKEILNAIPKKGTVEKMLQRYVKAAVKGVEDVDESSEVLEADGVSQRVTKLTAKIDSEVAINALVNILEEIKKDDDVKKFIDELSDIDGIENVDYDEVMNFVDETLDRLNEVDADDILDSDVSCYITLYVNGKGEIIGTGTEMTSNGQTLETASYIVTKGTKFGMTYKYTINNIGCIIEGSGKYSFGKINGDLKMSVTGAGMSTFGSGGLLDISLKDIDLNKLKDGIFNGEMVIEPGSMINMFLRYSSELSDLADLSIVIEGTSESNKDMYTEMRVEHDGDTLISLTDTFKTKKSSPVDIPDNYCSMEEWADDLDPNYLMYRLIDAGVSRSVVQPNSYRYSY